MYMEQDSSRLRRFLISGIIFLLIAGMIMANSVAFQLLDSMLQGFFATDSQTSFKTLLMTVVSALGSPKMAIVYVVIIAFLLWGFKYKIPAIWAIATLGSGDVVAFVIKNIVNGRVRHST